MATSLTTHHCFGYDIELADGKRPTDDGQEIDTFVIAATNPQGGHRVVLEWPIEARDWLKQQLVGGIVIPSPRMDIPKPRR